jgi:DNA-binding Lrp family transcriptional regulator
LDVDGIDRKILAHLQTDGRITLTELADRVSLSITRCQRRVRDLEASGAIRGYRAVVDPAAVGPGFEVLVFATVVRPEAVTSMQPWPISRKSSKPNGSSATPTT